MLFVRFVMGLVVYRVMVGFWWRVIVCCVLKWEWCVCGMLVCFGVFSWIIGSSGFCVCCLVVMWWFLM